MSTVRLLPSPHPLAPLPPGLLHLFPLAGRTNTTTCVTITIASILDINRDLWSSGYHVHQRSEAGRADGETRHSQAPIPPESMSLLGLEEQTIIQIYGPFIYKELVTQFQNTTSEESKEKIVAHLANFAYDPYNYSFLRQLNVVELFLDCLTEPNEKLVEFGAGGICNSCVDPVNAAIIIQCGGIPLIIQCLSSPVRNIVNYSLGALYYLCNSSSKEEILKPEVIELIRKYAAAEAVSVSFSNLANAFLDKHARPQN